MLEKVRGVHDLGFPIIPLHPRSKRPVGNGWTAGAKLTWDELSRVYKDGQNLGVRLGAPAHLGDETYLAVLDCDVKSEDPVHEKEMEKRLDSLKFDWVSAPTVLSGRGNGSKHIYVRTSTPAESFTMFKSEHEVMVFMGNELKPSKREVEKLTKEEIEAGMRLRPAWEISFMGTGKQVVLPFSIHPSSGKPYTWKRELRTIADLPLVGFNRANLPREMSKEIKVSGSLVFAPVDLTCAKIPDWAYEMILFGQGMERFNHDGSGALYGLAFILIGAGFTDNEIASILTDPGNEISDVAFRHVGKNDRMKAAAWVIKHTVLKARTEKSAERAFKDEVVVTMLSDEEAKKQEARLLDWEQDLDRNQFGLVKPTAKNLVSILNNVLGKKLISWDEFFDEDFYTCEPPWADGKRPHTNRPVRNKDITKIKLWLSKMYKMEPNNNLIHEIIMEIGDSNSRHPVREYLKSLVWDGIPRVNDWLEFYMGATGNQKYLEHVGRKFLCASIARVMTPGCKWDYVVIFEGAQGVGKSSTCDVLFSPWFSDSLGDINSKDVVDSMRGKWGIELGELSTLNKNDVETLKQFVSRREDVIRKAYMRKSETYPRQSVLMGTTNKVDYLKDETGNRRYLPVPITKINLKKLREDKDMLWAEAFQLWKDGEPLYLEDKEIEEAAKKVQFSRMERDALMDALAEILERDDFLTAEFTPLELWKRYNPSDLDGIKFTKGEQMRFARSLKQLGYESFDPWCEKQRRPIRKWRRTATPLNSSKNGD